VLRFDKVQAALRKLRESIEMVRQFSKGYFKNLKALQLCLVFNQHFTNDTEAIFKIQKFIENERMFIKTAHK
jgi:hypothetical protein